MNRYRYLPHLGLAVVVTMILTACDVAGLVGGESGSGSLVTESRDVGSFSSIDVSSAVNLDVTIGSSDGVLVEVTYDDNILDNVKTRVANDTLIIELDGNLNLSGNIGRIVTVAMPSIESLAASGASSVTIRGESDRIALEVSGASDVDLSELTVIDVAVEASGASDVRMSVTGEVTGSASGASEITIGGNPTSVLVETSGASSVDLP